MTSYWNQMADERGGVRRCLPGAEPPGFVDPEVRAALGQRMTMAAGEYSSLIDRRAGGRPRYLPSVAATENQADGEFRTKTMVLNSYDRLIAAGNVESMPSVLTGRP